MDEKKQIDGPEKETEEDIDGFTEAVIKFREELPYNKRRYIMIIGIIVLFLLVVYLGYAYGGLKMCTQVGGILDSDYICQLEFTSQSSNKDRVGQTFIIPNITMNERGLS